MKKLIIVSALGLVVSAQAFAAGSTVQNSRILNDANISNSRNLGGDAAGLGGGGGDANMGTVKIKESRINNSTVSNRATVRNSTNVGGDGGFLGGKGGEANMGAIVVE